MHEGSYGVNSGDCILFTGRLLLQALVIKSSERKALQPLLHIVHLLQVQHSRDFSTVQPLLHVSSAFMAVNPLTAVTTAQVT